MHNVILTGIPRSGTTLAGALVDSLPDCVCLNEPYWQVDAKLHTNPHQMALWLKEDFIRLRAHMLAGHPVPDRRDEDGKAITDFFARDKDPDGQQFRLCMFENLPADFTLAIKHNALYLAALPELMQTRTFQIITLIRNPVDTVASWRRLQIPISRGYMPHAARYWPELKSISESNAEVLVKQVQLYDLICQRLLELRNSIHILPYETLVATPEILCRYLDNEGPVDSSLIRNQVISVPDKERQTILAALQKHGKEWKNFYSLKTTIPRHNTQ